ncbi:L,D-transpeptidase [Lottiidibacillus patelloidae]|uniref:L,D-transpeptidase n=1 Tax=Lottiidibacillus patelloidae TaxID=2670334 RepID=A0A263BV64_9BACI|nr:L,D-transpeptidase [Lottiidibacillus patelloidae]OZM57600.1 L,D-transpeptidase [Lottiidibacillus patelloidae]
MLFSKVFHLFIALTLVSPIWPIGENPMVGDPFIIVNKTSNELAFIDDGKIKNVFKVSTGVAVDLTPEGKFTITVKAKNPYYRKKDIPGGAKENPLGTRWIGFDAKGTDGRIFGIHGNNNPAFIGKYVTQGCVRMYEEDVQYLYDHIRLGTKVVITHSEDNFWELGKKYGAIK